jgi:hypothetical protein
MGLYRRSPQDDALLDVLRERRRAPNLETVAFLERLQTAATDGPPPARAAGASMADMARRMAPGATEDEIREVENYWATVESLVRQPTVHEQTGLHATLQLQAVQLDNVIHRFPRWRSFDQPPLFGLMGAGQINARTYEVPSTGDHIVLIDTELLTFLHLFSKAVALAIPMETAPNGMLTFSHDLADVRDHLASSQAVLRFADAVLSYVTTGRTSQSRPYQIPPDRLAVSSMLREAAEVFILAHEYVHILERHHNDGMDDNRGVDGDIVSESVLSMSKEMIADRFGLDLTNAVLQDKGNQIPGFYYWAAELFLFTNEILLKAISLLRCGKSPEGLRGGERHQHASIDARRLALKSTLGSALRQGTSSEAHYQQVWSHLTFLPGVVQELWNATVPILQQAHADGLRPTLAWDA